ADDGLFESQFLSELLLRKALSRAEEFQILIYHEKVLVCWGVDVLMWARCKLNTSVPDLLPQRHRGHGNAQRSFVGFAILALTLTLALKTCPTARSSSYPSSSTISVFRGHVFCLRCWHNIPRSGMCTGGIGPARRRPG